LSEPTVLPEREVRVEINGAKFAISSDDIYLDYVRDGFEPEMVALFKTLLTPDDVVLDIGANIGCTAILFRGLSSEVHAFEPSETTFAFLERNITNSGLNNVFLNNFGLGLEKGSFELTLSPLNRSGGFISNQAKASVGHRIEKVDIKVLDEVVESMKLAKVDFVKIDVEGFEGHVLRGAKEVLKSFEPIVVLELNHWCLNALQRTSVPDFLDLLRSIFPILLAVDGENYMDLHVDDDNYVVMYQHILHMRFPNIVACFNEAQLEKFRATYNHGFELIKSELLSVPRPWWKRFI
jgi:FkbM family methyltransferase